MAYKDGVTPQKGDAVLGTIGERPARGKVLSWNEKTGALLLQRRGDAVFHEKSGQTIQGDLEQVEGQDADFVLLHRPVVAGKKTPVVVAKEA